MSDKANPEALRLAAWLNEGAWHQMRLGDVEAAGRELRRQHARIAELEAEIAAVGAGGVHALSAGTEMERSSREKLLDMRHYLEEAHGFAAMSPRGKENIAGALEILDELVEIAASPTPPAEQQAQPGAVYAELPDLVDSIWPHIHEYAEADSSTAIAKGSDSVDAAVNALLHDFADRTHAMRLEKANEIDWGKRARELHNAFGDPQKPEYSGCGTAQAAPKAAPGEPSDTQVWAAMQAFSKHDSNSEGMRAALIAGAAASQPAPAPLSEREAFEDWYTKRHPTPVNENSTWAHASKMDDWEVWQARAALAAQGGK